MPSPLALADGLTRDFLLHHRICPLAVRGDGTIVVASGPDAVLDALDEVSIAYRAPVVAEDATGDEVDRLIERLTAAADQAIELLADDGTGGLAPSGMEDETADVRDLASQPPVVRYVNLLVRDAHGDGASDIHLEATPTGLSARVRVDGVLVPATEPPAHLRQAVVSRIKLLAELDIAERRKPQDGRIRRRGEARSARSQP